MAKSCKQCMVKCDKAGSDESACKEFLQERSVVINTSNIYSFPDKIEVRSRVSDKVIVFRREVQEEEFE